MRMWILNFLLLALAKSVIGCRAPPNIRPLPGMRNADYNANRNSLGKLEPTLIDALRESKKK